MASQSEIDLENDFINELLRYPEYESAEDINDEHDLEENLKKQLEKFNKITLLDDEFKQVLDKIKNDDVFSEDEIYHKAKILRDRLRIDTEDDYFYIKLFDETEMSNNTFQVAHQISVEERKASRYDVTIIINGLPLVQIELKRKGGRLKDAFDQIIEYNKSSYDGLFGYIQIFVISNGVDTKYFANNNELPSDLKYTFTWMYEDNTHINDLIEFSNTFLKPSNIHSMISNYMVFQESTKGLMVLRAYQKHAVEAVLNQAKRGENGYVWHTTGSGKTLTSYKVSELLAEKSEVHKVIFVVDRRDLDNQTYNEFNNYQPGSVNSSNNTDKLVENLLSQNNSLVLTTIQKLNLATQYDKKKLSKIQDKKIILIYDECHRGHFGKMHKNITKFFTDSFCYGFTGTPIFDKNSRDSFTTKSIFGKKLHQYLIQDAISDGNVLGFLVEYWDDKEYVNPKLDLSTMKKEELERNDRLETIVDFIVKSYKKKTYDCEFNAMLAVSSNLLDKYYSLLKKKAPNLKVATIFSTQNDPSLEYKLDSYIEDYNELFKTNHSRKRLSLYNNDISKRMKNNELDLLLVVDMYLTGFDSKYLNTLFLDKTMTYHSLLQAFSRTNRVCNNRKDCGHIVSFRYIRKHVNESIELFSNENPSDVILLPEYKDLENEFNDLTKQLKDEVGTVEDMGRLKRESDKVHFMDLFKKIRKVKHILDSFIQFSFENENIIMKEQEFNDFNSKYMDIADMSRHNDKDQISELDNKDFEMDLLGSDTINEDTILDLIDENKNKEYIMARVEQNEHLYPKREPISKFLDIMSNDKSGDISEEYSLFMEKEKYKELNEYIKSESLDQEKIINVYKNFEYDDKLDIRLIQKSFNKKIGIEDVMDEISKIEKKLTEIKTKYC